MTSIPPPAQPLVSIITPAYNAAKYIEETIRSVQAQSFQDWEMIIADDGSTDGTFDLAIKFSRADPRVRVLASEKNSGLPAVARNRALRESRAPFIALLDADDLWAADKLEKQLALMRVSRAEWAFSNSRFFGQSPAHPEGRKYPPGWKPPVPFFPALLAGDAVPCLTVILSRELLRKLGDQSETGQAFDESPSLRAVEDWDITLRMAQLAEPAYTSEVLAHYRVHAHGISKGIEANFKARLALLEKYRRLGVDEKLLRRARHLHISKNAIDMLFLGGRPWRKDLLLSCLAPPISVRDLYLAHLVLWPSAVARKLYNKALAARRR